MAPELPDLNSEKGSVKRDIRYPLKRQPTSAQADLASRLARIYEEHGVLKGLKAYPLHESCPKCKLCWRGVPASRKPKPKQAGIVLPWVGRDFAGPNGGFVVAGQNLPVPEDAGDFGGLLSEWWIYGNLPSQTRKRYPNRSEFAYAAGTYIRAIERAERGEPTSELPSVQDAASAWERCALVELVKCSPVGDRSGPTPEMWSNCLGEYLVQELAVLRPRALIVMGISTATDRVYLLNNWPEPKDESSWTRVPGLRRGRLNIEDHYFPVFGCVHSSRDWRSSVAPLSTSVMEMGLNAGPSAAPTG